MACFGPSCEAGTVDAQALINNTLHAKIGDQKVHSPNPKQTNVRKNENFVAS